MAVTGRATQTTRGDHGSELTDQLISLRQVQRFCTLWRRSYADIAYDGLVCISSVLHWYSNLHANRCMQADCGYDVSWEVLNARGWVAQSRERVYIVGFRRDLHIPPMDWARLKAQSESSCSMTLADVLEPPESPAVVRSSFATKFALCYLTNCSLMWSTHSHCSCNVWMSVV